MTKKLFYCLLAVAGVCALGAGEAFGANIAPEPVRGVPGAVIEQKSIPRIDAMPDLPATYKLIDWYAKARAYDAVVFDHARKGGWAPYVRDLPGKDAAHPGFGLTTTINDYRGANLSESLNAISAVMGAGLVGIDKTRQDGRNYARMVQNNFSERDGLVFNGPGFDKSPNWQGFDWWYTEYPNVLFYGLADVFPQVEGTDHILRRIADTHLAALKALDGNFAWSYFDYRQMRGMKNHIPLQQDVSGAFAYLFLNANRRFGDTNYLVAAKAAMDVFANQRESRFYEVLHPFGIYSAGVLNATAGTNYDIGQLLTWLFEGNKTDGRNGWGILVGTWGPYDVSGLQGSLTDGGGYAFCMNSFAMAWPLVPLVKYQPQYARAIAKWMLNDASASRLFYPQEIDDAHQFLPELKDIADGVIAYEGLRRVDRYHWRKAVPIAEGDGPSWNKANPPESMFSLYGSSHVGIMGAIVSPTDVTGILRLDCNVTDFFAPRPEPVNLYYNPYDAAKTVTYSTEHLTYGNLHYAKGPYELYDRLTDTVLVRGATGPVKIVIPPKSARLLVERPVPQPVAEPAKGVDLFKSGTAFNGRPVKFYRIPAICRTNKGTLLAVCDQRPDSVGDLNYRQPTRIVLRRSTDNGRSWSELVRIHELPWNKDEAINASDPSLLVDRETGRVFCFWNAWEWVKDKGHCRQYVQQTDDDGATWSAPAEITAQIHRPEWSGKSYVFISSGHGTQLKDGTLVHTIVWVNKHQAGLFGSTDHGRTWKPLGTLVGPGDENKFVELQDGAWMINTRLPRGGGRGIHVSRDRGRTWTTRIDKTLADPACNAGLLRLSDGRLAFSNCNHVGGPRRNICVRTSRDDGATWSAPRVVDPGLGEYSDLVELAGGEVGIIWEKGPNYRSTRFENLGILP